MFCSYATDPLSCAALVNYPNAHAMPKHLSLDFYGFLSFKPEMKEKNTRKFSARG